MSVLKDEMLGLASQGIKELCTIARRDAVENGWWEDPRSTPELIALMHSELSEALECERSHEPDLHFDGNGKPLGAMSEYADVIIRICDAVGSKGHLLGEAIEKKVLFNRTRGYKHGGKAF